MSGDACTTTETGIVVFLVLFGLAIIVMLVDCVKRHREREWELKLEEEQQLERIIFGVRVPNGMAERRGEGNGLPAGRAAARV